jgi:hypothetical protein
MKVWESMARKKRSQSKTLKGQRRAVIRGRAHTDQEVFTEIAKAWRPLMRGVRKANAEKRLFEITISTLLAAKLMLRLANEGKLHFEGDPVVWERLEQISDDLAETHFETIASSLRWAEAAGIRLKAEREYLHLMRDRTVFRWCRMDIRDDETRARARIQPKLAGQRSRPINPCQGPLGATRMASGRCGGYTDAIPV